MAEKAPTVKTPYTVLATYDDTGWQTAHDCEATSSDSACRETAQKLISGGQEPPFWLVAVPTRSFRPLLIEVKAVEPQLTLTPVEVDRGPVPGDDR